MDRRAAEDFPREVLDLFDEYVHGGIGRREFLERAARFAVGGVGAAALLAQLSPNYAWAQEVPADDPRIKTSRIRYASPDGTGEVEALRGRELLLDERGCALEFGCGARLVGFRGRQLRTSLGDNGFLTDPLRADAGDGRGLGVDAAGGCVHGQSVIAGIDLDENVASLHRLVVDDGYNEDIAADLGRNGRHVGFDVGVVGCDDEAPLGHVAIAVPCACRDRDEEQKADDPAPLARGRGISGDGRRGGGDGVGQSLEPFLRNLFGHVRTDID